MPTDPNNNAIMDVLLELYDEQLISEIVHENASAFGGQSVWHMEPIHSGYNIVVSYDGTFFNSKLQRKYKKFHK